MVFLIVEAGYASGIKPIGCRYAGEPVNNHHRAFCVFCNSASKDFRGETAPALVHCLHLEAVYLIVGKYHLIPWL